MSQKYSSKELDVIFQSLANSTRRKIIAHLAKGSCSIGELGEPFEISMAAISKHVKVLEKAGLVRKEKKANVQICHLTPAPAISAGAFVKFLETL